jgi:hypothetical protein
VRSSRNQAFTTVNENQKDVIKARLSTMRQRYPGQLLPFHGIQNFGPETEFLDAAVFMFTLGGHSLSQTNFAELDKITILLEDHMAEAEVALLFTRQISRIQYAIRFSHSRDIKVKWALARQTMYTEKVADSSFIDSVTITRILDTYTGACKTFWQIIKSVPREANGIQDTQSRKGSSLDSHKLAVRIRSHIDIQELPFQGVLLGKQLCVSRTEFPIHIHLPDNIVSQEFEMTPFKNLDQKAGVLRLYLELLAHLAAQFGEAAYAFWPQISPGTTFFNDFWRAIPRSELKLFVSVETTSSVEMRFPLTLSYSQAIFDTTPDHISASLRGLFTNLDIRNVVRPRDLITDALRQTVNISCVDPPFVRSLLKLPDAEFALLDIWAAENFSCQTISNILDFALKDVKGGDLQELDGCLCLPLANRTLGALRLTTEHINGANRADVGEGDYLECIR